MAGATLTLQDVADLACVRRPVVSMWRQRPTVHGAVVRFPEPVDRVGGVERFDRDEIVAYLEATGRGNNPEARQDAPALSVPPNARLEVVVVLLCLYALSGEELAGRTPSELRELAERVDPQDTLVLREVRSLGRSTDLQRYVDDLVEASFGPGDALDRVHAGPARRADPERGLTTGVLDVVRAVANACRTYLGGEAVALAAHGDPALAERLTDGFAGLLLDGDGSTTRSARRRARLREVDLLDAAPVCVRVLSVVGMELTAALDAVDDLTVSLGPADAGIVLGPASALCDRLDGALEGRRAETMRSGSLAIAMRLSRGMWKAAHRQQLALWVVRGGRRSPWLYAADLDGLSIDREDLAADVVAALDGTGRRAYRYARRVELAPVLADASPVVARGVRVTPGVASPSGHLDAIRAASLVSGRPIEGYDVAVAASAAGVVLRQRSLRELVDAGHLACRRGSRIDPAHGRPDGTVRVLTADGGSEGVRLDPLDAERFYPHAVRTEPGDVVFAQRPRPAAQVDEQGGALVASPSRILRVEPSATIGPHALAALINQIAPDGTEWQTWNVPDLPPADLHSLDGALQTAAAHQRELREHERALRDLTRNLIQGVAAGAVTIDPTITTEKAG